jgi:hypothetical protein
MDRVNSAEYNMLNWRSHCSLKKCPSLSAVVYSDDEECILEQSATFASPACHDFQPGSGAAGKVLLQSRRVGHGTPLEHCMLQLMGRFRKCREDDLARTLKPDSGWLGVSDHSTDHNDTITDRIARRFIGLIWVKRSLAVGWALLWNAEHI